MLLNVWQHVWYLCVSEESKAVQEIADSIQDLSVEANSDAASSDLVTGTTNPASIATADNWGTSNSLSRLLQKPSTDRRQTVDWQRDWKPDQDWSSVRKEPIFIIIIRLSQRQGDTKAYQEELC